MHLLEYMAQPKKTPETLSSEEVRLAYPRFAKVLHERQKIIEEQERQFRAHLDEQIMTAPGDEADSSVIDVSADYFLNRANAHQRELIAIMDALDRMARGVYGVCESCGEPIAIERLEKLPYGRLCINCQTEEERNSDNVYPHQRPKL